MEYTSSIGFFRISRCIVFAAILLLPFFSARAQSGSVGVAPYVQPKPAHIRLVFGYGGNAGLGGLTPSSFVGNASYQTGASKLTAAFVSNTSVTNDLPRRNYFEFDMMYGISFNEFLTNYEGPSDGLHTSLSAGISVDSYRERWRPYGRRPDPYFLYPPTTFEYSVGVPVQFQTMYEPFRYDGIGAGIGAILFANFSHFAPSYGGAIVVEATY